MEPQEYIDILELIIETRKKAKRILFAKNSKRGKN